MHCTIQIPLTIILHIEYRVGVHTPKFAFFYYKLLVKRFVCSVYTYICHFIPQFTSPDRNETFTIASNCQPLYKGFSADVNFSFSVHLQRKTIMLHKCVCHTNKNGFNRCPFIAIAHKVVFALYPLVVSEYHVPLPKLWWMLNLLEYKNDCQMCPHFLQ